MSNEKKLLVFFACLLSMLILRLFILQIVQKEYRREVLLSQHYTKSDLIAKRWQVYVTDKGGKRLQLTENVEYFTLYVDPKFVKDQPRVIEVLTPIVYEHFCHVYGLDHPDSLECIKHLQDFTNTKILPEKEGVFVSSGDQQYYLDGESYDEQIADIVSWFTKENAYSMIAGKLTRTMQWGIKSKNYLWFIDNEHLLAEFASLKLPYIDVQKDYYVYIVPDMIADKSLSAKTLQKLLQKYGYYRTVDELKVLASSQEIRYVRILKNMNAKIAKMLRDAKREYFDEKVDRIPLLHGFWLEENEKRYYPHESFMSHIVWYVDKQWLSHYGIEEYFDDLLSGEDGKIIWLATPWIGQVGANSFEIAQPRHGVDVYLTIDPVIQKEVESWIRYYQQAFRADTIAITILDPNNGKIKALANYPTFNPNDPDPAYRLRPLTYDERYIIEDETYIDIPVFLMSGGDLRQAFIEERKDPFTKKYIFENYLWPQVFVDKNIWFPYEPGSIFKALTLAIGIDSDALSMFDFYNDPGRVRIWPYTISNISDECEGDHSYLHALEYSCNVGMVRMAQTMTKYVFYAYLKKLGFGKLTGVELAGEDGGTLPDFNTVSQARFFNNAFGQGLLATPLQMAVGYSAIINGGYLVQPTIVEAIYDPFQQEYITLSDNYQGQIFKWSTVRDMKEALVSVVDNGNLKRIQKEGYGLWGKTGTSEIAFKGKYQWWNGWTNGSFVGIVTKNETKYVLAIQVRRPRTTPWWLETAGKVFSSISDFLLSYDKIES